MRGLLGMLNTMSAEHAISIDWVDFSLLGMLNTMSAELYYQLVH